MNAADPLPETLGPVVKALRFATHHHRDQRRKNAGRMPYINHPVEVMGLLWEHAGVRDPVTLAAALLHDVVEDCEVTPAELAAEFGDEITRLVLEVTDDRLPQAERRAAQVRGAAGLSPRARLIRIADKVHNTRSLREGVPDTWDRARLEAYVAWARAVVDVLRGTSEALEALFDEAVGALEE